MHQFPMSRGPPHVYLRMVSTPIDIRRQRRLEQDSGRETYPFVQKREDSCRIFCDGEYGGFVEGRT
jgi:hypothetical protein